jgi:DNA-binding transcriptional MerR regulator
MYLFKAKQAAQAELDAVLAETGLTLEQVRAFLKEEPALSSALHHPEHRATTTTADLVYEVAERIGKSRTERALLRLRAGAQKLGKAVNEAVVAAPETTNHAVDFARRASAELLEIAKEKGPGLADGALGAAKAKLATLPFVKQNRDESSVATAAE